jgi:hypothetical protein
MYSIPYPEDTASSVIHMRNLEVVWYNPCMRKPIPNRWPICPMCKTCKMKYKYAVCRKCFKQVEDESFKMKDECGLKVIREEKEYKKYEEKKEEFSEFDWSLFPEKDNFWLLKTQPKHIS